MAKKPLEIDCIAGSALRDTQGEMLSVEGADISELEAGRGRWNDNHGKGFFNSIGRITKAKKIFKRDDCEDDRQRHYWDKVKAPYIYAAGYLYDDEDHPNARAAAAILRNIHKADTPLQLKASVEGGVVARGLKDPSLLARTKIHSIALTFTPANNATLVEPTSLDKSHIDEAADMLLIKSVLHLAQTNVPSFRHIARDAGATKVQQNLQQLISLMKDLGIEGDIRIPSKQTILQKALEQKIKSNVEEIHQRIHLLNKADEDSGEHIKHCDCGTHLTTKNADFIGVQKLPPSMGFEHNLKMYNCPDCHTTVSVPSPHTEEDLDKGIKDALAAGAMSAGLMMSPMSAEAKPTKAPASAQSQKPAAPKIPVTENKKMAQQLKKDHPILGAICEIESSGGKNVKHATIKDNKSVHYGHTAGGICGMMPHTAAFILKNDKELANKYPELALAAKDVNSKHRTFTDKFNHDPKAAADFAIAYMKRNKSQTMNDNMLVYSWKNGLAGSWKKLHKRGMKGIENHPYVQGVMKEHSKIAPKDEQESLDIIQKALMAGYGGAGAPGGSVGGTVLQSESLEDGRPGFKYITCDNCGKEQIYAKYQVKCRDCGHSLSLEKLYNVTKNNK